MILVLKMGHPSERCWKHIKTILDTRTQRLKNVERTCCRKYRCHPWLEDRILGQSGVCRRRRMTAVCWWFPWRPGFSDGLMDFILADGSFLPTQFSRTPKRLKAAIPFKFFASRVGIISCAPFSTLLFLQKNWKKGRSSWVQPSTRSDALVNTKGRSSRLSLVG